MLSDFSTKWDDVWKAADAIKPGATIKDAPTTFDAEVTNLKRAVDAYQTAVNAYNTKAKAGSETATSSDEPTSPDNTILYLVQNVLLAFQGVWVKAASLDDFIRVQVQTNANAPSGALQMPDATFKAVCNPPLEDLCVQVSGLVQSMMAELLEQGWDVQTVLDDGAVRNAAGVAVSVEAKPAETGEAPSWLKNSDLIKAFIPQDNTN